MSVYKEYNHVIPSLEVYPRIHFFSKRYHDIKEKYRKFTDKSWKKLSINQEDAPQNYLEHGLTIKVVGQEDLDPTVFIATDSHLYTSKPSSGPDKGADITYDKIVPVNPHKDCTRPFSSSSQKVSEAKELSTAISKEGEDKTFETHPTAVVICSAVVESLNEQGLEDIKLLWDRLGNTTETQSVGYFLLCQSKKEFTASEKNVFRKKLAGYFGDLWQLTHIFTRRLNEIKIGNEISLFLEDKLVLSLLTVQSSLQTFMNGKKRCSTAKPLLEEEIAQLAVRHFLQQIPNYGRESIVSVGHEKDLKGIETTEKQVNEPSVKDKKTKSKTDNKFLMEKFAQIFKCFTAQALSKRYNIRVEHCNNILIKRDFEETFVNMFSAPLHYRVQKIWESSEEVYEEELQLYQKVSSPSVLSILQKNLLSYVTGIEKDVGQFATSLRKLLFEINGCLKKTKVDIDKIKRQTYVPKPKVDYDLRKEMLRIKEVYGVGTIYGQLEIHVSEVSAIKRVESQIRDMLRKNNVSCPFSVRAIEVKLEMLADHSFHEHGERIECQQRKGTLAGFLEGNDQRLYGLTCAHVVKAEEECDVFIYDGSNSRLEFAKCVPHMIVSTGSATKPLIDLAAVRVNESVENKCSKFLKNDDSMLNPGVIAADTTEDLAGNYVYKHGATTQFTKGLVSSDDYSIISTEDEHYIFLIENYDDDGEDIFAQPGDSGSMICTPDENEVYIVKAVGVLNGRKVTPTGEDTQNFFSFRLIDGLRKLTDRAQGVQFNFPKKC